jgi:hypothetical protein
MASRRKDLMAKAKGFTASIGRMPDAQRHQNPRPEVGEDYNLLRSSTAESFPGLVSLLPPLIRIERRESGGYSAITFSELDTFCEQIYQMLTEQSDD